MRVVGMAQKGHVSERKRPRLNQLRAVALAITIVWALGMRVVGRHLLPRRAMCRSGKRPRPNQLRAVALAIAVVWQRL